MLKPFVPIQKMKIPVERSMMDETKKEKLFYLAIEILSGIVILIFLYLFLVSITG